MRRFLTSLPLRYSALAISALVLCISCYALVTSGKGLWWLIAAALLVLLGLWDMAQKHHAILRNYPIMGHFRFIFEFIRPEIRQYFIEGDTEAQPFSRAQRSLVYQRSKGQVDNRPFGTQLDVSQQGYEWVNHSMQPTRLSSHDFRVWIGGTPDEAQQGTDPCSRPYHASVFNISAMSFGALSGNAIQALNQGAKMGGFIHDTGEGSISQYHRMHGGDLIWEVASGYFGCRNADGTFSDEKFIANATDPQVKMIEIKLSQGAKPGHGGMLPGAKVTPEIAAARGIPVGVDCISPSSHSAFSTPVELMQFVAKLRRLSGGKPTGFKFCVGHPWEWFAIVKAMLETGITPDFIVVDGSEGGTGAAPVEFTDHLGVPLREGLLFVHNTLVGAGLRQHIRIGASGKVVSAFDMASLFAIGADWVNSARGFMFAIGCIQSQSCHTNRCPTGVATQDAGRQRALVVPDKAERVLNFHRNTLKALAEMMAAAGVSHPKDLGPHHLVRRISSTEIKLYSQLLRFVEPGSLLSGGVDGEFYAAAWKLASAASFEPASAQPA